MSRVTVSIVNWNTRPALERCLASLTADTTWEGSVVVIDNASVDGSAEMVRQRFPQVTLIANEANVGFAAGNNLALRAAPADYHLILNPDIEVPAGAIRALVAYMESAPRVAAAAPALVGHEGRLQPHLYRRFPSVAQVLLSWTALSLVTSRIGPLRRRIAEHDIRGTAPVPVDQVPGAAMMIRRAALDQVGELDPGYFIWFEDVDWCYRARQAGHEIHVVPSCRMRHEGGASFGRWSLQTRAFQFYRAFFRFLCKHRMRSLIRVALPVLTLDLLLKGAVLRVRRRLGGVDAEAVTSLAPTRRALRAVVRAWRQGRLVDFTSADVAGAEPDIAPLPAAAAGTADRSVDVVIVNWNARRYLPACIDAVRRSTIPVRIVLVDNASTDGSVDLVRSVYPDVAVVHLETNVGYAGAANIGLRHGNAPFAIVMNPDVRLAPDHLERLARRLAAAPSIGAAQGKLYRISADDFLAGRFDGNVTIDSAGHTIARTRMVFDRGQGQPDAPSFSYEASIFSACGAALFLRRAMLEDIAPDGEYFSESFFAYKEDIDLGWRARLRGWDIRYLPDAVAWHVRNAPATAAAWRRMPLGVRRHSWKNHYLLMIRNDRAADLLIALPLVAGWELLRLGYALIRDPRVLGGYVAAARELPAALRARRAIRLTRRVGSREMRRWFGGSVIDVRDTGVTA